MVLDIGVTEIMIDTSLKPIGNHVRTLTGASDKAQQSHDRKAYSLHDSSLSLDIPRPFSREADSAIPIPPAGYRRNRLMRAENAGFTGKIAPARNYAVYVIPAEGDNLSTTEETIRLHESSACHAPTPFSFTGSKSRSANRNADKYDE
jgi:hypothetical protein